MQITDRMEGKLEGSPIYELERRLAQVLVDAAPTLGLEPLELVIHFDGVALRLVDKKNPTVVDVHFETHFADEDEEEEEEKA